MPMGLVVNTSLSGAAPRQVTLPLRGAVDVVIDWGGPTEPGCPTSVVALNRTVDTACTYTVDGTYGITITGTVTQFGTGGPTAYSPANAERIVSVTSWGMTGGLPRELVTSDLWRRVMPWKDVHHAEALSA
jgi:hypothetical protein